MLTDPPSSGGLYGLSLHDRGSKSDGGLAPGGEPLAR